MREVAKLLDYKVENVHNLFEEINYFYNIFESEISNKKWIEIPNKNMYFNKEIMACYPNFLNNFQDIVIQTNTKYEEVLKIIRNNEEYSKYSIAWNIQTYKESINSFYNRWHPMESSTSSHRIQDRCNLSIKENNKIRIYDNDPGYLNNRDGGLLIPIFRLGDLEEYKKFENGEIVKFESSTERVLYLFLKNELIPIFIFNDETLKERYSKLINEILKLEKVIDIGEIFNKRIKINNTDEVKEFLSNIDKARANIDLYDRSIICDPNGGHWELYEDNLEDYLKNYVHMEGEKVYPRDPRLDIKKGGIVGIDFGTKSTVVVFQDDKNITLPMRISGNILNEGIKDSDYENPTVIEFKNIESFMTSYNEREGRPFTNWEDITVSHTAFNNIKTSYYSIVSELKQWAGSKKEKLLIKDQQGIEKLLNPYLELNEEDIDPIEIYAYYIGSYINNMRNGVYLEYFLSFPVTYEKEIRERILASFTRGIKKSLPKIILEDEKVMKKFKVKHGANEPAAYAVCALQEYGFEPEDDEKIYYGVFDFGGGTLDFDFGIFRESEDNRYDYDLEHFGAGGDRYLGGENILKELAYETFKENLSTLREKGITFSRPEWCDRFMGDETLVDSNGNSKLNTQNLIDRLRVIWEKSGNLKDKENVNQFNKNREYISIQLNIDEEKLNKIIYSKIEGGVKNFFIAMEKAFKNDEYDKVYVLLAGNSCKHPFVKEIFEKYIQEKNINIEILPALGTEEAYLKLEEFGIKVDREDKTRPTGKTGVAYGLLESTADSSIRIINRDEERNNEINFKYYVGNEKKKKLKPVLNPSTEYNTFNLFSYVKSDVFNIYYTTLPEALEGNLPIDSVKRVRITLDSEYDSETMIYLRAVGADIIEYAVTKKDINEKEYLESGKIVLD